MRIGLGVINFLPTRFVVFRTDRKANVAQKCRDSKGVPFLHGFCLFCLSRNQGFRGGPLGEGVYGRRMEIPAKMMADPRLRGDDMRLQSGGGFPLL